jgi:hypothetical protein
VAAGKSGDGVDFGHGLSVLGQEEERVVAESGGSTWNVEDFAFDGAVGYCDDFAVTGGAE